MKTSHNKNRITHLVCLGLALCLISFSGSVSWAVNVNVPADELIEYLQGQQTTQPAISGTFRVRGGDDDGELRDFAPYISGNRVITASGSPTITYGTSGQSAKADEVEFCFDIVGGSLTFSQAAKFTLSGGYSGYGLFYVENGSLTFEVDAELTGNESEESGGAITIYQSGNLTFARDAIFTINKADADGGALSMVGGIANFNQIATFSNNEAGMGGALDVHGAAALTITGAATFNNNKAVESMGGAVVATNSILDFKNTLTVRNNNANDSGGAFYLQGVEMTIGGAAEFTGNQAELDPDKPDDGGGAIFAYDRTTIHFKSTATFGGTTLALGNTSKSAGGAIYVTGDAALIFDEAAVFQHNRATAVDGQGGAVYVDVGNLEFKADATFRDNMAGDSGGAM